MERHQKEKEIMPRKITTGSIRYKLAQLCLRLLYGKHDRPYYISPWKHVSVASVGLLTHHNKVLLSYRRGNIEGFGKLGLLGGFLEIEDSEQPMQGLLRELWEETTLNIPLNKELEEKEPLMTVTSHNLVMNHTDEFSNICFYYHIELTKEQLNLIKDTEESYNAQLYSLKEVKELQEKKEIYFQGHYDAILKAVKTGLIE